MWRCLYFQAKLVICAVALTSDSGARLELFRCPSPQCESSEAEDREISSPESSSSDMTKETVNSLDETLEVVDEVFTEVLSEDNEFMRRWKSTHNDHVDNLEDSVEPLEEPIDSGTIEIPDPTGGWDLASEEYWANWGNLKTCEIDEFKSLSYDRFYREYYHQKPVKIKAGGGLQIDRKKWQKTVIIEERGEELIDIGDQIEAAAFNAYKQIKLKHYIENITSPDSFSVSEGFSLVYEVIGNRSRLPNYIHSELSVPYLSLVRSDEGIALHSHDDVFFQVIFGSKRWGFGHPTERIVFNSQAGYLEFLKNELTLNPPGRVQQCMQNAGEMIYIPRDWYHGSLSFGEVVGMGLVYRMSKPPRGYTIPMTWTDYVVNAAVEAHTDLEASEDWLEQGLVDWEYCPKFNAAKAAFHIYARDRLKKKKSASPEVKRHLKEARKFWLRAQLLSPNDHTLGEVKFMSRKKTKNRKRRVKIS